MHKEILHLRKKFFALSTSISFVLIFIMLLILNILMNVSYKNELKTSRDMITQVAYSNAVPLDSETIELSRMNTNENGDKTIPRNPAFIKSVTINGVISCTDPDADWYCAGGGIFFEQYDEYGNMRYIHKEYKFNKGNTKITVDFTDNSNFLYEGKPVETDITKVSEKCFYVSGVWWTGSSTMKEENPREVILEIESIDIKYRDGISAASSENYPVLIRDFTSIYPSGIPQTLSNLSCFYIITDNQNNLAEINSGNTFKSISQESAKSFLESGKNIFEISGKSYRHFQSQTGDITIHAFVYNTLAEKNSRRLLVMSVLSGSAVFLLVVILSYFVSGRAVRPIKQSYEKQKEFISNAGHELKTPITVISATTELMEKKNGSDRLVSCVKAQADKMSRLVNEMLDLTRLSNPQKASVSFQRFDMSRIVRNTVLYFESRAFEEVKTLTADIEDELYISGDPDKTDELTGILIDNALKYSDERSDIRIRLFSENNMAVLTCENLCSSFDTADIPHLFERFYRADKSHSGENEGFGLGLSIAREIVNVYHGTISAEYKDGMVVFRAEFKAV